jgi:protein-tyrosine phosphatase
MRDLHNHLLYGIDDGSRTLDDSINLLNEMEQNKVTDIMFTPHYIIGSHYNANNMVKRKLTEELQKHTNINLYYGNEVYLDNDIVKYIEKGEISTLNGSRYILVEFPLNEKLDLGLTLIQNLVKNGYVPIIAHPERYHYYDMEFFETLIDEGCLLQGNITSLCGKYGTDSKRNLELLVKKHMIHLMGTDTHRTYYPLNDCYVALTKLTTREMYKDITANNFMKVVNDEEIEPFEIEKSGGFASFLDKFK